jgi:non-ribosomal peptide synthetase component F
MSELSAPAANVPEEQRLIRNKRLRPGESFGGFGKEELGQSIPSLFEAIAAKYPDRTAIKTADRVLTYAQLNAAANRVAHDVMALQGGESEPVGLLFEKDALLIAAALGILKAGKFFFLLDPAAPNLRTAALLADSQAKLLIANRQHAAIAAEISGGSCRVIECGATSTNRAENDPALPIDPASPMCIMYTSGSTGQPKGVLWSHQNWLHKIALSTNIFLVRDSDRITLLGSPSSPNAITTVFLALLNGATLLPLISKKKARGDWRTGSPKRASRSA